MPEIPETDSHLARRIYARMCEHDESFEVAAGRLNLSDTAAAKARDHLVRLGLADPATGTMVEAAFALLRNLEGSHRALDRVVQQQVMAASLAKHYLGLAHHRDGTRVEFYERGDHMTKLAQRFDEFAELATQEVREMHPPAVWRHPFPDSFAQRDRVTLDNGVRIRAVHAQVMLSEPGIRGWLKERATWGVDVRVAPVVPARMVIYDHAVAIVQVDPFDVDSGAVVVRGHHLVASLAALYDFCWSIASEPDDVPRSADTSLNDQQAAVLRLLASGAKDDAIARSLGVSTRTVTRIVGELTTLLGAGSRFQAGVRAAKLGWLDG